jgi:hypothetical protein
MNEKLKRILLIQILFFLNASFFTFIALKVWELENSLGFLFLYFFVFLSYRIIAMPISAWFLFKNKTKELMTLSFIFLFILSLICIFLTDEIENPYILIHFFGLPLAFFTTFFQIANNQMIAIAGKSNQFENFFYVTNIWKNIIEVIVPLVIGTVMYITSFETALYILLFSSIISIYISLRIEKTDVQFRNNKIKNIFKKEDDRELNALNLKHYIFIFVVAMVIQYLDISINGFQLTFGENPLFVGLLKTFLVILVIFSYLVKKKGIWSEETWLNISVYLLIFSFLLSIVELPLLNNTVQLILVLIFLSLSIYIMSSSSLALSFRLIDKKDDFGKFATLFKREIIRNLGKLLISFSGFYFSFENIQSTEYKILGLVSIVISLILVALYKNLNKE